ncbi:pentapeptide repeat-containing protein [Streptomyces sp. NPDC056601]|uniref:pentapeptide repeat-containing protein n=1 Tax=Streptomyces sp. NPDC056601 TaxID=3345875 RepID=UPI00369AE867
MALSLRRKREAPRGRYTPNLWPVWIVAPVALIAAGALGWVIYHYAYDHFAQAAAGQKPPKPVNINDPLKATVTALTLIGAVLAGLYAYRKQLLAEGDAHRADASQLAERYTTAAEQLGHEQAAVRLAGVYALARLADDWAEQRQVCVDVLCAYLRMPYEPDPSLPGHKEGEREVRHTIIQVIRDHLQEPEAATAWCLHDFNFTDAVFDGGNFTTSHFRGRVTFRGASFGGGTVSFNAATFSGPTVTFSGATFGGGTVLFSGATFSGPTVLFDGATFSGGTVRFETTTFSGPTVYFVGATFSGSTVFFVGATFNRSTVHFNGATLSDGTVLFSDATSSGSTIIFNGATFNGSTVRFNGATFNGSTVHFGGATFNSGSVHFNSTRLSGGTVSFGSGGTAARFSGTTFEWGPLPVPAGA